MSMSKDKWSIREKPKLDHLLSLWSEDPLPSFIVGHLVLEATLVQLIELKLSNPEALDTFLLSFPQKVGLAKSLGLIDGNIADLLNHINSLRNRFAHRLGYTFTFDDAFDLVKRAAQAGIDFSDDGIHSDRRHSEESYGIPGILEEVFSNTAMHLAWEMEEYGGEFCFC